jgi:glycosyltransferase involved in cell wall biosynthesis
MKIALVGPGLMPIPPSGWGAIESLIWKHYQGLRAMGHTVQIFNSQDTRAVIKEINNQDFDFVHVQYDEFAHDFAAHCTKPYCITSHYGYILKPAQWAKGYFSIFTDFLAAPGIIALSAEIRELYRTAGYTGPVYILKNGIDTASFNFKEKGNGKIICLGKIEPRKQQAQLARLMEEKLDIDFVGPIVDPEFIAEKRCHYLGVWTKEQVQQKLTEYSTLVLLSDGEAAPLVVIEALAAGLSVVISRSSAANLVPKDFITILDDDENNPETIIQALHRAVEKNDQYRSAIHTYAVETFDNAAIMEEYQAIIKKFTESNSPTSKKAFSLYKRNHLWHYYFSRRWLRWSHVQTLRAIKKRFQ